LARAYLSALCGIGTSFHKIYLLSTKDTLSNIKIIDKKIKNKGYLKKNK
jgi:hypothetical protein